MPGLSGLWAIAVTHVSEAVAQFGLMLKGKTDAAMIEQIQPDATIEATSTKKPLQQMADMWLPFVDIVGRVAVVSLRGVMVGSADSWMRWYGYAGSRQIKQAIVAAVEDDAIDEIVLRVNSPGGSVEGVQELADAVAAAEKIKPVTAVVESMGASAAYWVASQATTITAGMDVLIGSIGVRAMLYDFSEAYEAAGIKAIPVDTGEFKSAGEIGTEITDNQIDYYQGLIDATFAQFKASVGRGRAGMDAKALNRVSDGRVFIAEEALQLGLIDKIAYADDVMAGLVAREEQAARKRKTRAEMKLRLLGHRAS